jgi:DNA-binding CsgD family transcriptional regulator
MTLDARCGGMDEELSNLIGLTYEAAFDAELWPRVLTGLADLAGADVPIWGLYDLATPQQSSMLAPRNDPEYLRLIPHYLTEASLLSVSARIVSKAVDQNVGEVFALQSVVPADEFVRTDFYNEWWEPQGIGTAGLIAGALIDGSISLGAGVYKRRPRHHEPFTAKEIARFRTAMSHVARAVRIHRELRVRDFRQDVVVATLDRQHKGVVLVDDAANILFLNRAAHALLHAGDGLRVQSGRLCTAAGEHRLEALIASCADIHRSTQGPGGALEVRRPHGGSPLQILVVPLPMNGAPTEMPWLGLRKPVAIVTITDPDAEDERCRKALQHRYRLTAAEAAFAMEIAKGDGRDAAAARRGISLSTGHTHLAAIFEKTGTHRQAELARIVFECRCGA